MKVPILKSIGVAIIICMTLLTAACATVSDGKPIYSYALNGVKLKLGLEQLKRSYEPTKSELVNLLDKGIFSDSDAVQIKRVIQVADKLKSDLHEFSRANGNAERLIKLAEIDPMIQQAVDAYGIANRLIRPKIERGEVDPLVKAQFDKFYATMALIYAQYNELKAGAEVAGLLNTTGEFATTALSLLRLYGTVKGVG